jgi:hypothetical protein
MMASRLIASSEAEHEINMIDVGTIARVRINDWFWSNQLPMVEAFLASRGEGSVIEHKHLRYEFWCSVIEVRNGVAAPLSQGQFDALTVYNMLLPHSDRNLDLVSSVLTMERYTDVKTIMEAKLRIRYTGTEVYPGLWKMLESWYCNLE